MLKLNNNNLAGINGGGKALDYVVEGTKKPSEISKEIARRAYGSKWNIIK
ncbi:hypothetical protein GNF80_16585 [Clostridium perfringens]|nr:hypothetical protein [Clostridium perfringens]